MDILDKYKEVVGSEIIDELQQISVALKKTRILHINSTKFGGGVAEILISMTALSKALGLHMDWEVIEGNSDFFQCTKMFHNCLQARNSKVNSSLFSAYEKTNLENSERLKQAIEKADVIFIHDPQPAALIHFFPKRDNLWIWRCHIDLSTPTLMIWDYLKTFIKEYDASIFSLPEFVQSLPHPTFVIPPSIDPLSEKNIPLSKGEIDSVFTKFHLNPDFTTLLQVSRFDRFKDPIGVIESYQLAKKLEPKLQLILAGGSATDDPEGATVLEEVRERAAKDPDIHVLDLPPEPRTINALQRSAQIILQKSIKEGFGLTVTEAFWKKKPVIGGNTGGIKLQIADNYNGYLVNSPEEAALKIQTLLQNPTSIQKMGERAHLLAKDRFLITRHLRDDLNVILSLFTNRR